MLLLVRSATAKAAAQHTLKRNLRKLGNKGVLTIGHQGGDLHAEVYSRGDGALWASVGTTFSGDRISRYWNGFGIFDAEAARQTIVVETNVPTRSNSAQIAGYFAEDIDSGAVYLMHSGKVGGGRPGIGKSAFLRESRVPLEEVHEGKGRIRRGVVIGRVDALDLAARILRYVRKVRAFKDAADAGKFSTPAFRKRAVKYNREFSGRKSGKFGGSFEYFTYHGDIVDALHAERTALGENAHNTALIDLYTVERGVKTAVYEVKTVATRQSLYTAIGQLMTHSGVQGRIAKIVVLPADSKLPQDFRRIIEALNIEVRHFRVSGSAAEPKIELIP